jgi:hypothetical protein
MLAAAIVAVLALSGGTAWAIGTVAADTVASHHLGAGQGAQAGKHHAGGNTAKQRDRAVVRGTIAAIAANSWTIHTAAGRTVSVTVTASTTFGTKKHPETESQFAAGDRVLALMRRSGASAGWTAVRIATPIATPGSATPAPTS